MGQVLGQYLRQGTVLGAQYCGQYWGKYWGKYWGSTGQMPWGIPETLEIPEIFEMPEIPGVLEIPEIPRISHRYLPKSVNIGAKFEGIWPVGYQRPWGQDLGCGSAW